MASDTLSFSRKVLLSAGAAIGVVVTLYLLRQFAQVLLLVFGAVLFAVFLDGLSELLRQKARLPRGWALFIVVWVFVFFLFGLGWIAGPRMADEFNRLAERLPEAIQSIRQQITHYEWGRELVGYVLTPEEMLSMGSGFLGQITGFFSTAFGLLISGAFLLFVGVYLAASPQWYLEGAIGLLPPGRRERGRQVFSALGRALRWWLVGRFSSMGLVGVLTAMGLWVIGMPLAVPLGVIAALLSFIPYIGPVVSAVPALLLALGEGSRMTLYVIVVYSAVQTLESYFLTPMIQERAVSIPPAVLITSQLLMAVLFGLPGLLLSAPVTVVAIVLIQMLYQQDVLGDYPID